MALLALTIYFGIWFLDNLAWRLVRSQLVAARFLRHSLALTSAFIRASSFRVLSFSLFMSLRGNNSSNFRHWDT